MIVRKQEYGNQGGSLYFGYTCSDIWENDSCKCFIRYEHTASPSQILLTPMEEQKFVCCFLEHMRSMEQLPFLTHRTIEGYPRRKWVGTEKVDNYIPYTGHKIVEKCFITSKDTSDEDIRAFGAGIPVVSLCAYCDREVNILWESCDVVNYRYSREPEGLYTVAFDQYSYRCHKYNLQSLADGYEHIKKEFEQYETMTSSQKQNFQEKHRVEVIEKVRSINCLIGPGTSEQEVSEFCHGRRAKRHFSEFSSKSIVLEEYGEVNAYNLEDEEILILREIVLGDNKVSVDLTKVYRDPDEQTGTFEEIFEGDFVHCDKCNRLVPVEGGRQNLHGDETFRCEYCIDTYSDICYRCGDFIDKPEQEGKAEETFLVKANDELIYCPNCLMELEEMDDTWGIEDVDDLEDFYEDRFEGSI